MNPLNGLAERRLNPLGDAERPLTLLQLLDLRITIDAAIKSKLGTKPVTVESLAEEFSRIGREREEQAAARERQTPEQAAEIAALRAELAAQRKDLQQEAGT